MKKDNSAQRQNAGAIDTSYRWEVLECKQGQPFSYFEFYRKPNSRRVVLEPRNVHATSLALEHRGWSKKTITKLLSNHDKEVRHGDVSVKLYDWERIRAAEQTAEFETQMERWLKKRET